MTISKSTLYNIGIVLPILALAVAVPAYFYGRGQYQAGYSEGFKAGQESIKCGGGSHFVDPWQKKQGAQ